MIAIENGSERYFVNRAGTYLVCLLLLSSSRYCYFFCLLLAFPREMGRWSSGRDIYLVQACPFFVFSVNRPLDCTSLSDNLLLLLASIQTASIVQHFSQSATSLLLLVLQMLSLVWCAFSAFTVSGQRIHPFHHHVAVQLPICHHVLTGLACETAFHGINFQHIVETLLLSVLFPLFLPQHRKAGWVFMIINLHYTSGLF